MSSRAELCEYHARECLQAAERTDNPRAREVLIRLARDWLQDALAETRQSKVEHPPRTEHRWSTARSARRMLTPPQSGPRVLWIDLNHSESW
jgi:transposase